MVKRASWLELKGSYEAIGGARFPPHPFHGIAGWLPVVPFPFSPLCPAGLLDDLHPYDYIPIPRDL